MVDRKVIDEQLKKIDFNLKGWGRSEVNELHHIILPDEEIYEAANGIYEAGFALLLSTDVRVLLVDKKPLNFLTVEDLRFDMINEIDYNHRIIGASIIISTGNKTLNFRSYNKQRLYRLIGHVQRCMAEAKRKQTSHGEDQSQHLERINKQLQAYLVAQYRQQEKFNKQLARFQSGAIDTPPDFPEPIKPDSELSDYLYSRGLIDKYQRDSGQELTILPTRRNAPNFANTNQQANQPDPQAYYWTPPTEPMATSQDSQLTDIYDSGIQEVFGRHNGPTGSGQVGPDHQSSESSQAGTLEVNPIKVALSKLPMLLRSRKFGLGSLHSLHTPSLPSLPSKPIPDRPEPEPNA